MKFLILLLLIIPLGTACSFAQDVYALSGGEIIFQSALVETTTDDVNTRLRFTTAFHLGEFVHIDFGNHFGIFSGMGIRNVGFITDENDIRTKYRSYSMGIPLAFKIGSFKKNMYVFAGGEYEWLFHFKQKVFIDEAKYKYSSWFSNRTSSFIPSAFAGLQFPGGIQLKVKYYLNDFLNHEFNRGDEHNNYTLFRKTQVWYISLSFLIRNKKTSVENANPPVQAAIFQLPYDQQKLYPFLPCCK